MGREIAGDGAGLDLPVALAGDDPSARLAAIRRALSYVRALPPGSPHPATAALQVPALSALAAGDPPSRMAAVPLCLALASAPRPVVSPSVPLEGMAARLLAEEDPSVARALYRAVRAAGAGRDLPGEALAHLEAAALLARDPGVRDLALADLRPLRADPVLGPRVAAALAAVARPVPARAPGPGDPLALSLEALTSPEPAARAAALGRLATLARLDVPSPGSLSPRAIESVALVALAAGAGYSGDTPRRPPPSSHPPALGRPPASGPGGAGPAPSSLPTALAIEHRRAELRLGLVGPAGRLALRLDALVARDHHPDPAVRALAAILYVEAGGCPPDLSLRPAPGAASSSAPARPGLLARLRGGLGPVDPPSPGVLAPGPGHALSPVLVRAGVLGDLDAVRSGLMSPGLVVPTLTRALGVAGDLPSGSPARRELGRAISEALASPQGLAALGAPGGRDALRRGASALLCDTLAREAASAGRGAASAGPGAAGMAGGVDARAPAPPGGAGRGRAR